MFDHRLTRVMHQDKMNAAEARYRQKTNKSESGSSVNEQPVALMTKILRFFSAQKMSSQSLELETRG